MSDFPVLNTDRELWRETAGDAYAPAVFVTKSGGIGINVGGRVVVLPVRTWHKLAASPRPTDPVGEEAVEAAARALYESTPHKKPWEDAYEIDRTVNRNHARIVLQAARHMGGDGGTWTLADLREANVRRQAEWCSNGEVPDLSFRGLELAGEVGEACNVAKKLERERLGWRGSRSTKDDLATELADVVICADLMAIAAGVELMSAVRDKFNATTDKVGLTTKLATGRGRSEG